ncbi:hypothetical protein DSO57_1021659 [Entomophthora muscae]|uniref:Uncharacterized protein n=1 Tax=Entomophthora muscae TaxID=34485 RepID=A0ACC2SG65_9FUNG|nr:hypothetical protein DSO57_1021659 [Entomophthora muscae]
MEEAPKDNQEVVTILRKVALHINEEVKGHPTFIILDGGFTSLIISKFFLRSLEIQEYRKVRGKFIFANRKTEELIEAVNDLSAEICGTRVLVSSPIFEPTCYKKLLRHYALNVGVLSYHHWPAIQNKDLTASHKGVATEPIIVQYLIEERQQFNRKDKIE